MDSCIKYCTAKAGKLDIGRSDSSQLESDSGQGAPLRV